MDIKVVWIPSAGKNAYLLSVIDVHTRKILLDLFAFSIKQTQVIAMLSKLFMHYQYPDNVVIRSDNGSQFIAKYVSEYLGLIGGRSRIYPHSNTRGKCTYRNISWDFKERGFSEI